MGTEIHINEVYLKRFVESLRPSDVEIRRELDFAYTWEENTAILFEIRPYWDDPNRIIQSEFAKIRYTKTTYTWSLYWMRSSGKWVLYDPHPKANNLQELLSVIKEDEFNCFFG